MSAVLKMSGSRRGERMWISTDGWNAEDSDKTKENLTV